MERIEGLGGTKTLGNKRKPDRTFVLSGLVCWLPSRNKNCTKPVKSVWEVTPYYTRLFDKRPLFVRGKKPKELAEISRITSRQWKMYETHMNRKNPVLIGLRYLKVFEEESVNSYAKAAQVLGVSRIRVYQLTSLVTKLPSEITDYLLKNYDDPGIRRQFSERRLRPLTKLPSKKAQLAQFREMVDNIM